MPRCLSFVKDRHSVPLFRLISQITKYNARAALTEETPVGISENPKNARSPEFSWDLRTRKYGKISWTGIESFSAKFVFIDSVHRALSIAPKICPGENIFRKKYFAKNVAEIFHILRC